ncbi:TIGR00725 family protein [Methanofollis formosanus]|uniref:TIGR00725 family protein n=1 Tax=Methanofollis formosanus TaxID=299308 RepID=A0A8G1A225_9EURY|nr:TIGR00725 family protein [Methanofollis formosanus]QYZ78954.1 TIGR00725 family protein [Methanofollis formosanus]
MQIAVIGAGNASSQEAESAETVGYLLAQNGAVVVCGGLGGVMEAACRGAKEGGGTTVGIISGTSGENPYVDIVVRSGLGHARNTLVVGSADAVVAVGGAYGTLSEIAFALTMKKAVFGVGTWEIDGVVPCLTPEEAVLMAVRAARPSR